MLVKKQAQQTLMHVITLRETGKVGLLHLVDASGGIVGFLGCIVTFDTFVAYDMEVD